MYYNGQHTEIDIAIILTIFLNCVYMHVCVFLSGNTAYTFITSFSKYVQDACQCLALF